MKKMCFYSTFGVVKSSLYVEVLIQPLKFALWSLDFTRSLVGELLLEQPLLLLHYHL